MSAAGNTSTVIDLIRKRKTEEASKLISNMSEEEINSSIRITTQKADKKPKQVDMTPLMAAAEIGDEKLVAQLLEKKATDNPTKNDGRTALMIAAWYGHTKIINQLLGHFLKTKGYKYITHRDKNQASAISWATKKKHRDAVTALNKHVVPIATFEIEEPKKVVDPEASKKNFIAYRA